MELTFQKPYISIKAMPTVEMSNFSVLTGINGSGKTHLLKAVEQGFIKVNNLIPQEIVYFNNATFKIDPDVNIKSKEAKPKKTQYKINAFQIYKQRIDSFRQQTQEKYQSPLEKFLYQIITTPHRTGPPATIGTNIDFKIFEKALQDNISPEEAIQQLEDSVSGLFKYLINQLLEFGYDFKDFSYDLIESRISTIQKELIEIFRNTDEDYFSYLYMTFSNFDRLLHLTQNDFDELNLLV